MRKLINTFVKELSEMCEKYKATANKGFASGGLKC